MPGRAVAVCTYAGVTGQAMARGCNCGPYSFSAANNASSSQIVVTEDRGRIKRKKGAAHLVRLVTAS
jgi:hypothetical protein